MKKIEVELLKDYCERCKLDYTDTYRNFRMYEYNTGKNLADFLAKFTYVTRTNLIGKKELINY